jgi:hypothetical protein
MKSEIVKAIEEELDRFAVGLATVGLTARFRGLVRRPVTGGGSSSTVEAEIGIYDEDDKLFDMLEFFVEQDGRLLVQPAEVRDWLQREVEQIIEDYPLGKGWEEVT